MTTNDDLGNRVVILFMPCFADSNGVNDENDTNDEGERGREERLVY